MAGWEGKAPAFTLAEELDFAGRLKTALGNAFYKSFRTNNVNTEASRAAEAYALVCAAEAKLDVSSKASLQAEIGDNYDAMQTMKRKLCAQFELATRSYTPTIDETVQMARTYASLIESQAAQVKPGSFRGWQPEDRR